MMVPLSLRFLLLPALLAGVLLTGCTASRPAADARAPSWTTAMAPAPAPPAERTAATPARKAALGEAERRLRAATVDWYGTPYRFGGTTRDGIDCSAFVRAVYRETFGVDLPRTTAQQVHEGVPVRNGAFVPGDLVFFRPSSKGRHVGIYLGRGEFVHAGTSTGVTISHLDEPYWQQTYWTTRRLLPAPLPVRPAAPLAGPPRARASRTSW